MSTFRQRYARCLVIATAVLGVAVVGHIGGGLLAAQAQTVFTVNSTGDNGSESIGDGACDTGTSTPGGAPECTLRAAIEEANHDPEPDTIRFDTIPRDQRGAALISPLTPLTVEEQIVLDGTTAPTELVVREGDLRDRIQSIRAQMPGADSEGFQPPTEEELEDWHTLIEFIRDEDVESARSVIAQQFPSYTLIRFSDTVTDQVYWLLEESSPIERGWGAVVMNPAPDRNLLVEAPHPVFELNTEAEGVDLFRETGARALVLAGTHRCSNAAVSSCDGQTGVCGSFGSYRESDDAHVVDAPFQVTHTFFSDQYPELTALSLHGHGSSACEAVFLSDGVSGETASAVEDLQAALNDRGVEVGIPGNSSCPLEGTTNVQGRYTNGSTAPCTEEATSASGQFIHIEQSSEFRDSPESYAPLINAVQEVYPLLVDGRTSPPRLENEGVSEEPIVGIDGGNLPSGSSGLVIEGDGADGTTAQGVAVFDAPRHGIRVSAPNVTIQNIRAGLRPNGEEAGNGHSPGTDASVGALSVAGDGFAILGNVVSGNQSSGIQASGQGGLIRDNVVGADADLQTAIPNAGTGLHVDEGEAAVRANVLFGNGASGIRVENGEGTHLGYEYGETLPENPSVIGGGQGNALIQNDSAGVVLDNTVGTAVRGNQIEGNGIGGIRMDGTYDGDDAGDTDEGVNRSQNFPVEVSTANCDDGGSQTTVEVSYRVRSDADSASASNYGDDGLKVDFYRTDSGETQGKTYLGTDTYAASEAGTVVTTTLTTEDASCTDEVVATATDADGNTSQFTPSGTELPVELASFDGTQTGDQSVRLIWETSSEQNNAGFRVQQATESGWSTLSFVEGAGTTTEARTYRFDVEDLEPGTHRFRLTQVDLDGSTTVHDPVSIRVQMEEALQLMGPSPNPVSERSTVSFAVQESEEVTLQAYNVLGQKVATLYRGAPAPGETITVRLGAAHVGTLPSGTYFLRLEAGGHTTTRQFRVIR